MKFLNVLQALWCEPWLIMPDMHQRLCDIVDAHFTGAAHKDGGIATFFDEKESEDQEPVITETGNYAVIPILGTIGKRVSSLMKSSGVTDVDDISRLIREALDNDNIKGILYEISSPGGTVVGVPELAAQMREGNKIKPSVAFTDQLMASAAYWLGSSCNAIYAAPSACIGSIGVYMAWLDESRAYDMAGLRRELIKQGKFKGMGIPGTTLSDEQRAHLQAGVEKIYKWFTAWVTDDRAMISESMQGQTFYADEAVKRNMIDAVGTMDDALAELDDMAELGITSADTLFPADDIVQVIDWTVLENNGLTHHHLNLCDNERDNDWSEYDDQGGDNRERLSDRIVNAQIINGKICPT